jgi:integrase/recombinase XerC
MYFSNFFDYLSNEKKYSENTITAYKKDLNTFHVFCKDEHGINNISKIPYSIIRSWIVNLSDSNLSPLTINRKISALSRYYDFLIKLEQIDESPTKNHKRLKVQSKIIIPFTEDEVFSVINVFDDTFEGKRGMLIIDTLYSTGIRRDELIKIKLNDLLFDENLIKIQGKRNKERLVPILPSLLQNIKDYIKLRSNIKPSINNLFITKKGTQIGPSLVYRVVKKYFSKVSSKVKTSPHILRHSFATHLLNNGADINTIKEILGHSSLASTQIYTKIKLPKIISDYKNNHPREIKNS